MIYGGDLQHPNAKPLSDVQRGHPNSARPRRKPGGVVGNAIRRSARRERIDGAHPRRLSGSKASLCAAAERLVVPNTNVEVFIDIFAERPGVRASGAGPGFWTARSGGMCTHEPLANAQATSAARHSVRLPGRHHVFRQNDRISESDKEEAATARSARRRAAPSSSMSRMHPGCTAPAGGGRRGAVRPAAHTAPRRGKRGGSGQTRDVVPFGPVLHFERSIEIIRTSAGVDPVRKPGSLIVRVARQPAFRANSGERALTREGPSYEPSEVVKHPGPLVDRDSSCLQTSTANHSSRNKDGLESP